ncbi:tetratricopeptide repeat protein [Chromobacterium alticapitis]|uniref:Pilus assembly protein PilF n=1 Tax=Chromobacterium alticapitis TaxID=2073169 RepID=A0A2S5DGC8_9NEIS|nr:tetratricopeptide repeat protein [Chromobacterium alticapitis]POZ62067.1 pilus assembly protein PilF [Chromobacterium alticapitis]
MAKRVMIPFSSHALSAAKLLADGDLVGALRAAQQGLQAEPCNAPLWNLLGVCAAGLEQPLLAEHCWRQALALDSATPDAQYNLGCLSEERGEPAQAEAYYRAELTRDPHHPSSLGNLGNLLQDAGRLAEAETCFRSRLAAHPSAAAHYQLGRLLRERGAAQEAARQLQACLEQAPEDVEALQLLGQSLAEQGAADEAEAMLRRALSLEPGHAAAGNNLGVLLMAERRWEEAEALLRGVYARQADAALPNLAALLCATGRAAEAEALARQAAAEAPDHADWLCLLGVALADQARGDEAEAAWARGLAIAPKHRRLRQNLGYLRLARGEWQAGWEHHEARLEAAAYPSLPSPRWQGESLAGRRLLVLFEQGYGDAIQFSRYLVPLLARGAARVIALCRAPLLPLFVRQWPQVEWLSLGSGYPAEFPPHDCHVFSMSLPWALREFEPRAGAPYLEADPAQWQAWRERLPAGRNIGLVWRGRAEHPFDHCRSLPGPEALLPLLADSSINWISLQPEPTEAERAWLLGNGLLELGSGLRDFADSAALLAALDGLIAVDTALAHLAGALGQPCRVLLADEHVDWRWGQGGDVTAWYASLTLERRRRGETWEGLAGRLAV